MSDLLEPKAPDEVLLSPEDALVEGVRLITENTERNPEFRKLSSEEQRRRRTAMFTAGLDPILNDLGDRELGQELYKRIVEVPTLFADESNPDTIAAADRAIRIAQGDPEAISELKRRMVLGQMGRSSLIANAAVGLVDLFDGEEDSSSYTFGTEADKANELALGMGIAAGTLSAKDAQSITTTAQIAGGLTSFVETAALQYFLIGNLAKGGLLTKGAMGKIAEKAATMKAGTAQRVMAATGEQAVQALVGAGYSALDTTVKMLVSDPETDTSLKGYATRFGADIALDWTIWAGISTLGMSAKITRSLVKDKKFEDLAKTVFSGTEDDIAENIAHRLGKGEQIPEELWAQFTPEAREAVMFHQRALRAGKLSLKGATEEEDAQAIGLAAGYHLMPWKDADGNEVIGIFSPLDMTTPRAVETSYQRAANWSVKNNASGVFTAPVDAYLKADTLDAAGQATLRTVDKMKLSKGVWDPDLYAKVLVSEDGAYDPDAIKLVFGEFSAQRGGRKRFKIEKDADFFKLDEGATLGEDLHHAADLSSYDKMIAEGSPELHLTQITQKIDNLKEKFSKGIIVMPEKLSNPTQERMYFEFLKRAIVESPEDAAKLDDLIKKIASPRDALSDESFIAVKNLFHRADDPNAEPVHLVKSDDPTKPNGFKLKRREVHTDDQGRSVTTWRTEEYFDDLRQARVKAVQRFFHSGKASPQAIAWSVSRATGYRIQVPKRGSSDSFKLIGKGTRAHQTLDSDKSLLALLDRHPDVYKRMALPDELGPKAYVIDPNVHTVSFEDNVMVGPAEDILREAAHYADPNEGVSRLKFTKVEYQTDLLGGFKKVSVDAKVDPISRVYEYRAFPGAKPELFATPKDLATSLENRIDRRAALKAEALLRGYRVVNAPDGSILLVGAKGTKRFASQAELDEFFKGLPVPEGDLKLSPGADLSQENIAELDRFMREKSYAFRNGPKKPRTLMEKLTRAMNSITVMSSLAPTESSLAEIAKRAGDAKFMEIFDDLSNGFRMVERGNRKVVPLIHEIWKGTTPSKRAGYVEFLTVPRDRWASLAKARKLEWTPEWETRLVRSLDVLDSLTQAANLGKASDFLKYGATFDEAIENLHALNKPIPESCKALWELRVSGGQMPVPAYFSQLMNGISTKYWMKIKSDCDDPALFLLSFCDRAQKLQYMAPLQAPVAEKYLELLKAYKEGGANAPPESALKYLQNTIDEMFGESTVAGTVLKERTQAFTKALGEKLGRVPFFKDLGFDRVSEVDDIIGKLGGWFTFSTQAARLWAVPRNLLQVANLASVTGNTRTLKNLNWVLDHAEYIDALQQRAAIEQTLYDFGGENFTFGQQFTKALMRPLEVTDVITRAVAIKNAEDVLQEARGRFIQGITTADEFIREVHGDLLEDMDQVKLIELTKVNPQAAADFLGMKHQSWTMYSYERWKQGTASRGTIGRLWGKLGVYPLWTVDHFRRVLSRGSTGARLGRAARIAATSTAVYWASQEAGVPYDGFLASDAFGFSGGPFFENMIDMMQMWGTGPEAKMARSRLKRNLPRELFLPAAMSNYAIRAYNAAEAGDAVEFLKALAAAPTTPEMLDLYGGR